MTGDTVKFTCHGCGGPVVTDLNRIRLTLDPTDPSAVVVLGTCPQGHPYEQRLHLTEHSHHIKALITAGAQTPDSSDVEAHLTALTDATAWLHSDVFDTDRAALRLTGGAA